jgi:hypothetical protein
VLVGCNALTGASELGATGDCAFFESSSRTRSIMTS